MGNPLIPSCGLVLGDFCIRAPVRKTVAIVIKEVKRNCEPTKFYIFSIFEISVPWPEIGFSFIDFSKSNIKSVPKRESRHECEGMKQFRIVLCIHKFRRFKIGTYAQCSAHYIKISEPRSVQIHVWIRAVNRPPSCSFDLRIQSHKFLKNLIVLLPLTLDLSARHAPQHLSIFMGMFSSYFIKYPSTPLGSSATINQSWWLTYPRLICSSEREYCYG